MEKPFKLNKAIGRLSKSKQKKLKKLSDQTNIFAPFNYESTVEVQTQDKDGKETIVKRRVSEGLNKKHVQSANIADMPPPPRREPTAAELAMDTLEALRTTYGEDIELFDGRMTMPQLLEDIIAKNPDETHFAVVNLRTVIDQALRWKRNLPRVQPFYAIKSCPDINIVRILHLLGVNFDCASKGEIEMALSVGAKPSQIIFANPAKGFDHLKFAREHDVRMMTFDNLVELEKIVSVFPDAELVLRIASNDKFSRMPFGFKFGASFSYAVELIQHCIRLNANLIGISFHVGSGALSSVGFIDTLHSAAKLFEIAEAAGKPLHLLDIGGGFPGDDESGIRFEDIARDIAPVIDELFPPSVSVIAEPGRYFCTSVITLALKVYAKREYWSSKTITDEDGQVIALPPVKEVQYYVPDGQYGSFNNIMYDHSHPVVKPLREPPLNTVLENTTFFGPTCDSIDVIAKNIPFPPLELNDWIWCPNMGAYTIAAGSRFNGFERPTIFYRMSINSPNDPEDEA